MASSLEGLAASLREWPAEKFQGWLRRQIKKQSEADARVKGRSNPVRFITSDIQKSRPVRLFLGPPELNSSLSLIFAPIHQRWNRKLSSSTGNINSERKTNRNLRNGNPRSSLMIVLLLLRQRLPQWQRPRPN